MPARVCPDVPGGGQGENTEAAMTRWSRSQRDRAKKEGKVLVGIAFDARLSPNVKRGGIDFAGPVDDDEAREVIAFLEGFLDRHVAKGKGEHAR